MWLWHSAEESEHRCTAFDVYKSLGGNEEWRIRLFHIITVQFLSDVMLQTIRNLWQDRQLFKLSTWKSGYQFLQLCHPNQQDDRLSQDWLAQNQDQFKVVGQSA
ncbi:MAG: hypothetical protein RIS02_1328 [Pseudomonadota bacterium]